MSGEPYDISIANITDEAELQRLYDACHKFAEETEKEITPLRIQYADLVPKLEHLEHMLTAARSKERVIKSKLDATKALTTLAFKCWYQAKDADTDEESFFYPQHKNAANRIVGIRVTVGMLSDWDKVLYRKKGYDGDRIWRACQTTMSGVDCEKLNRLRQTVLTGRNIVTDLEKMRRLFRGGGGNYMTFGIFDGQVIILERY